MPELPEVETVVRDLRPRLRGRRIHAVAVGEKELRFRWQPDWTAFVVGRRIEAVRRRGKWMVIELDAGRLLCHLGMTGQLRVARAAELREPHTHLIFDLGGGRELRFRDVRRFGSIRWCPPDREIEHMIREKLGPEPWDLDAADWHRRLRCSRRALKAMLLDQSVVAGVGNIYADESLFLAKIWPRQRGSATTREQAERLRQAIVDVLERAIAGRGSTIRDYVDGAGRRGGFQLRLLVYGRGGEPCATCRTPIRRVRLGGRSSHYCPNCQKPARSRART